MTRKEELLAAIDYAKTKFIPFIGVVIKTEGNEGLELIVNPYENFDNKRNYYAKAYNDNLVLNTFAGISIHSWVIGELEEISKEFKEQLEDYFE